MQRIVQPGQADQTINKSRFIALAAYCADERAIGTMLRGMATAHAHAHHLAYAFRVKTPQGIVQRFHDAGEPSGTAGMPILQHLEGCQSARKFDHLSASNIDQSFSLIFCAA